MVNRTEAIKNFLKQETVPDLAALYNFNMECQVNVSQDGGERVKGEFKGKNWTGWTDGTTVWKAFRIPYSPDKEPNYEDKPLKFDLAEHAEAIGMTGWDWKNQVSKWVAFDFDTIVGHSEKHQKKLDDETMQEMLNAASKIDWVTIRRSSSGNGYHLYVFLNDVPTSTHTEHAALSRAIIGKMSAISGFDFSATVDACGGNMWVWHRKAVGTSGFEIIKQGNTLSEPPLNWEDHLNVIKTRRYKAKVRNVQGVDSYEELSNNYNFNGLTDEHTKLIKYLEKQTKYIWWWDMDRHILVTHTHALLDAYKDLNIRGIYSTISTASNPMEQNCFAYPLSDGGWAVRRFSKGCAEAETWQQDGMGWTRCYFNKEPSFEVACRAAKGQENSKGEFVFKDGEDIVTASNYLGTQIHVPQEIFHRQITLKRHKDGRIIVSADKQSRDDSSIMDGWLEEKNQWMTIVEYVSPIFEDSNINYDNIVRHLVTECGDDAGWVMKRTNKWGDEPLTHLKLALQSLGVKNTDINSMLGNAVLSPFRLVNKPFQPEYPGNREWNRNGAQLKCKLSEKSELNYPHWMKILEHCGRGLNYDIQNSAWARANGIESGADYLKCWLATTFQKPEVAMPMLFFYSKEQCTGKTMFHESLEHLVTTGLCRAETALTDPRSFNGEIEGAIFCVVEEIDLNNHKIAYNRLKDWITSDNIMIHPKSKTPYMTKNTTHWIFCANDHKYCPIYPGDTRIVVVEVPPLSVTELVPKNIMQQKLHAEAPDFLTELLNLELPEQVDRLGLPVIETSQKDSVVQLNTSSSELFLSEKCTYLSGNVIKFSDLYEEYAIWCEDIGYDKASKIMFSKELPTKHPKGRYSGAEVFVGNIAMQREAAKIAEGPELMLRNKKLIEKVSKG